ncbi:MAG: prefoldin subunit alpha [Candidatus Hodarchaeales archaeon]|jgi:prefoldin alpha subunit
MSKSAIPDDVLNYMRNLQEEIDLLQSNVSTIEQQITLIYRVISSLNDAVKTQIELKTKKPGDEILIPIGGSNYILCSIKDTQQTFISLGSGITLLTELINSEKRNKNQINNLENSIKQLQEQHSQLIQKLNSSRQELMQILQKYQVLQ